MRKDFYEELILWFNQMLDTTIGNKPETISDYHFYLNEVRHELIQIVYNRLNQLPEQTKLTAEFFGITRKTVYNYIKSSGKN